MIIPIKCYTCGNILGSKYTQYTKLMNDKNLRLLNNTISKENGTRITEQLKKKRINDFMYTEETQKPIESFILDNIGLKRYCCRRIMISHVDTI